jgi:hypothetical protein
MLPRQTNRTDRGFAPAFGVSEDDMTVIQRVEVL